MTILTQPEHDSKTLVDQYGTNVRVMPWPQVSAGFSGPKPKVGQRYSVVLEQRLTNPHMKDQLRADRIDPDNPGHLGLNPKVGRQWGPEFNNPAELLFTVIGTYVLEAIIPNVDDLSFDFLFRLEAEAVGA